MNDLYRRWFEPANVEAAVRSALHQLEQVDAAQADRAPRERDRAQVRYAGYAAGGGALFLAAVIIALMLFAPKAPGREADYGRLALLGLTVIGGAGAIAYFVCGRNNNCRAERDEAFEQLCRQHPGLRPARNVEIEEDSETTIPWFHSEEWSHTYGLVSGEYRGQQIATIECTHVVDPILAATDSRFMQQLASVAQNRHKRLFLRAMQATIFAEPLPHLSDMVFVPRTDPSRAYYRRDLEQQDCDLESVFQLPRVLRKQFWMAAAEPEECGSLFATELPQLLVSREWCIVQVIGSHCVVFTNRWHSNRPGQAPRRVEQVQAELDFAHAVYLQLRQASANLASRTDAEDGMSEGMHDMDRTGRQPSMAQLTGRATGAQAVATAVCGAQASPAPVSVCSTSPTACASTLTTPARQPRGRRPHSLLKKCCLLGTGLPLLLLGLLVTMVFVVERQKGQAASAWPQVDARIVVSETDTAAQKVGGKVITRYKPRVSYEYETGGQRFSGDRISFGLVWPTDDRDEVDRLLRRYPAQSVVKVHHHPTRLGLSVLEPGLRQEGKLNAIIGVSCAIALIGLSLCCYAAVGKSGGRGRQAML